MKIKKIGSRQYIDQTDTFCVLITDGEDNYLLIEEDRGYFGKQLELVSGKTNSEQAIVNTVREKTGYKIKDIIEIISFFPNMEYTTEKIHCFTALIDEEQKTGNYKWISEDEFHQAIENGIIKDAKTIIAFYTYLSPLFNDYDNI
jgi:hypothetical protein